MARQVPYTLTAYQRRIYKRRIDKYQLRPVFLKQRPIFSKNPTLLQEKGGWRNLYLDRVDPDYADSLTGPSRMNTIGWYKGQVVFIFLRGKIGPVPQKNAFDELKTKDKQFTPCTQSARPELENAIAYNQHKNPLASEFNPGHRNDCFGGNEIVVSKHGHTKDCPATVKLVECMKADPVAMVVERWSDLEPDRVQAELTKIIEALNLGGYHLQRARGSRRTRHLSSLMSDGH